MARKRVAVFSADGKPLSDHITHPEAYQAVAAQKAEWIGQDYRAIRLVHEKVAPRGQKHSFFSDVWHLRESAGMPVWQVRSHTLDGILN